MDLTIEKPLKPAQFAENKLLEAILDNTYGPGDALPAERELALSLGVTRPTVREMLQRLSTEGWVTISHGKPTRVNHYLASGGLRVLNTLSRFGNHLSPDMIAHLLEARTLIFPGVAHRAAIADPNAILAFLDTPITLRTDANAFACHDWGLQTLMVDITRNPVLKMMFNDFAPVYHRLGRVYFIQKKAREMSLEYYKSLILALRAKDGSVQGLVEQTMARAQAFWKEIG